MAAPAQTPLPLIQEIKLPVNARLGGLVGLFWDEVFQFRVTPDQSLLILYPSTSGKWPLVRVRKWWTKAPETEELDLPGWSLANTFNSDFGSDLLVSPDGQYAIAMGGVGSVKHARGIPFPPTDSIEHKPDLLITVIDLEHWQIVGGFHTATVDATAEFRGAYIVNGRWLALQGLDDEPEKVKYEHLYDRVNRLISIPDLKAGPGCSTKDPEILTLSYGHGPGAAKALSEQNDSACADLLKTAGVPSMRVLDWLVYLGHDPEPENLMADEQLRQRAAMQEDGNRSTAQDLNWPGDEYNRCCWTSDWWFIAGDNPPFESAAGVWYQLQGQDHGADYHYQLNQYAKEGRLLKTRTTDLTAGPGCSRYDCVCSVVDVSEQQGAILALCRAVSLNFVDGEDWHNQWAAVFRAEDFSMVGDAELKPAHVRVSIAVAEGHTYVATVEEGKVVRVYSVPDR